MKCGNFEWVADGDQLARYLLPADLGLHAGVRAADIGCGTSMLPLQLCQLPGILSVTAIDREHQCIEHMALQHPSSGVQWLALDLVDGDIPATGLAAGSFELVLDKGTLDCVLVEGKASELLSAVRWLLAPGAVYAVVSFREKELLRRLLEFEQLGWAVERCVDLPTQLGQPGSLFIIRAHAADCCRGLGPGPVDGLGAHVQQVADWWYQRAHPLLTANREQAIRRDWGECVAQLPPEALVDASMGLCAALPLPHVYSVLFTPIERTELSYKDFEQDLREFLSAAAMNADVDRVDLETALMLIRQTQ